MTDAADDTTSDTVSGTVSGTANDTAGGEVRAYAAERSAAYAPSPTPVHTPTPVYDDPVGPLAERRIALVDLLDRLLAGGVVLAGDLTLRIADVDLVRIDLRAVISSVNERMPSPFEVTVGGEVDGP